MTLLSASLMQKTVRLARAAQNNSMRVRSPIIEERRKKRGSPDAIRIAVANLFGGGGRVVEIKAGDAHRVFGAKMAGRNIVVKAFRGPHSVRLRTKALWICKELCAQGIPHAKLLADMGPPDFPTNCVVHERVDGVSATIAVAQGIVDFKGYCASLGSMLRDIHRVKLPSFDSGGAGRITYGEFLTRNSKYLLERFPPSALKLHLSRSVSARLKGLRFAFSRVGPCLTHNDVNPGNTLVSAGGRLVLIDWDSAGAGGWPGDLTGPLFADCCLGMWNGKPTVSRRNEMRVALLDGYGSDSCSYEALERMEGLLHLLRAISLFLYYTSQKDRIRATAMLDAVRALA